MKFLSFFRRKTNYKLSKYDELLNTQRAQLQQIEVFGLLLAKSNGFMGIELLAKQIDNAATINLQASLQYNEGSMERVSLEYIATKLHESATSIREMAKEGMV